MTVVIVPHNGKPAIFINSHGAIRTKPCHNHSPVTVARVERQDHSANSVIATCCSPTHSSQ